LPRRSQVKAALDRRRYDRPPWDSTSAGFRDRVEGWVPAASAPHLHNRVHVWVGGDMLLSSSPNDPVFYLNHCNVDRIWAAWQKQHPSELYRTAPSAPQTLLRKRIDDTMFTFFDAGSIGLPP